MSNQELSVPMRPHPRYMLSAKFKRILPEFSATIPLEREASWSRLHPRYTLSQR